MMVNLNEFIRKILIKLLRKLKNLKGPSVEEFKNNVSPPWKGQERGF